MKFVLFGFFLSMCCLVGGYAQTSSCAQTLRLARSTYEQGRLHEIPGLLENCLNAGRNGFNEQERIDALKILTLTYIYLEEPQKADQAMLQLLDTDHFYEVNENVDPAEFVALFRTFRTDPVFSIGLKFGANATYPTATKNYFVGANARNKGEYSPGINIQYGLSFEKELFGKGSKWIAAPEIISSNHSFGYANESLTISDKTGEAYSFIDGNFKQSRLDLNLLVQYKLYKEDDPIAKPKFYLLFGAGPSLLLKYTAQIETQLPQEGSVVTGPSIDMKDTYHTMDYNGWLGGGVKFKFGDIYLNADVRYKHGFKNLSNGGMRSNPEAVFDYGFVSNDIRQSSVMVNIGFIYPYFIPKKILK